MCKTQKTYISYIPHAMETWMVEKNLPLNPTTITSGSNRKAWFKCKKCNHEKYSSIFSVVKGHGCPMCAGTIVPRERSLGVLHPELVNEIDIDCIDNKKIDIYGISQHNNKKITFVFIEKTVSLLLLLEGKFKTIPSFKPSFSSGFK